MSALGGTSVLREFLEFMAERARTLSPVSADVLRHELDSFIALGLAAFEGLGELSREAAALGPPNEDIIREIREAHAGYLTACQPVLKLIERARLAGVSLKRLEAFMETIGEANLITNRYERVIRAEREADAGNSRSMEEVRNELRGRIHPSGG